MVTALSLNKLSLKLIKGTFNVFCNKILAKPVQSTNKSPLIVSLLFNLSWAMSPELFKSTLVTVADKCCTPFCIATLLKYLPSNIASK